MLAAKSVFYRHVHVFQMNLEVKMGSNSKQYGFEQKTSSHYYPQGNDLAERAVQMVKSLLKKSKDPHMVLLANRLLSTESAEEREQRLSKPRARDKSRRVECSSVGADRQQ